MTTEEKALEVTITTDTFSIQGPNGVTVKGMREVSSWECMTKYTDDRERHIIVVTPGGYAAVAEALGATYGKPPTKRGTIVAASPDLVTLLTVQPRQPGQEDQPAPAPDVWWPSEAQAKDFVIHTYVPPRAGAFARPRENGVRVTHIPSGLFEECHEANGQHRNRQLAFERLAARLDKIGRTDDPRWTKTV